MSKQPFICHCGFNTMDTKKALEHSREHEMNENKLSREELSRELENWWREEENMKLGLLRAIALKGKGKDKYEKVVAELGLRKQAFKQIKSLLTPIPEDKLNEFVEKKGKELHREFKDGSLSVLSFCRHFTNKTLKECDELKEGKNG